MYITLEDAETFVETYILDTDTWDAASDANKTKALTNASRLIDNLRFDGDKTDDDQTHEFPRDDDTEIPDDVQFACVLIAMRLIDGIDIELEHENLAMVSQGYANVRSTYDRTIPQQHIQHGIPSIEAWNILKRYFPALDHVDVRRV